MSSCQPRRPAGVPTGGQFASKSQPAPGFALDADDVPGRATIDGLRVEPKVTVFGNGRRSESYRRYGQNHDPDDGRPAVVVYLPDGTVESEWHYSDGQVHDPADGRPAVVVYHPDGTVESEWHYSDGQVRDPDDGRPAVVVYHPDGTVSYEQHYRSDRLGE